jgi:hypothetical protein
MRAVHTSPTALGMPGGPLLDGSDCSDATIRTDAVYVVYTSADETIAAVRVAGGFAKELSVPVTLLHFRTVPYPLPADAPCGVSPAETEAFLARLRAEDFDIRVRACLCRGERQAISSALPRHSLVVVGGRRGWWPTEPARWRRRLTAAGHFVVFVDSSERAGGPQDAKALK